MIPRGWRIFLVLSLLLILFPFGETRMEQNSPADPTAVSAKKGLAQIEPEPTPTAPYHSALPVIYNYIPTQLPTLVPTRPGQAHPQCQLIASIPYIIMPGTVFEMRWTVKNTGSSAWTADNSVIRFVSGDRLHTGSDLRDLPYNVEPNSTVDIVIPMRAPETPGVYAANWAITKETTFLCRFYVFVRVQ